MAATFDAQPPRRDTEHERLPPGQRQVKDWPVLTYGATPRLDTATWRFRVWGEVEEETTWTWTEFLAIGTASRVNDIHCVTAWSRFENAWEGILFKDVLARIPLKPAASAVIFHCYGGYTTNLTLADLAADDHAMFAITHDGAPLPAEHGGPLRLVLPSRYFWKSAKWVNGMEFLPTDRPGFWEQYGYHHRGDPWTEERYS